MPVVSVKVEEELKRGMERYRDQIDWPEEIRSFIGGKIEQARRQENLKAVEKLLREVPTLTKGTSARLVREDRDSGH